MSKRASEKCTCSCFSFLQKRSPKAHRRPKVERPGPTPSGFPIVHTKFRTDDIKALFSEFLRTRGTERKRKKL